VDDVVFDEEAEGLD
jgi:hypothetical protein